MTRRFDLELHAPAARDTVLAQWDDLHQRLGRGRLATSPAWTRCWLDHYGSVVPHRFIVARAGGRICGMSLLSEGQRDYGPFQLRSLHLGTAGENDSESAWVEHNGLLVEEAYRSRMVAAVVDRFEQEQKWDQLAIDGFDSDLAEELAEHLPMTLRYFDSRYFDLNRARADGRDVVDLLGRSTRANLRRRLRGYRDLHVEWATDQDQAHDILAELMALHQARWQADGVPGVFASRRFRDFVRALVGRLFPRHVVMFRARDGATTIGCLCLLVDGGRLLDYLSGLAHFDGASSPGLVTHYLCMQEGLKRGFAAYDFLRGEKQHKVNLSTDVAQLVWGEHRRPRWKFRMARVYTEGRQAYRQAALAFASPRH